MSSLVQGLIKSLAMTVLSEVGDNTFFATAILAMRHPRKPVLLGCLASLSVMTVLSALVGWATPNLISHKWAHHITTLLFFVFGLWSLWDGIKDDGDDDEFAEVEAKLVGFLTVNSCPIFNSRPLLNLPFWFDYDAELNSGKGTTKKKSKDDDELKRQKRPFLSQFFSPIFLKAFSVTFFGEWGDKSQLATIGLAADENPFGVVLGGIIGQALCTVAAVLGGKSLASRISEKIVALSGGVLFIVFGIQTFLSTVES